LLLLEESVSCYGVAVVSYRSTYMEKMRLKLQDLVCLQKDSNTKLFLALAFVLL